MKNKVLKIGQEIEFTEDFEIERVLSKEKVSVKKGDLAIITSRKIALYTKGEAKGIMQNLKDIELNGYDHENIARMILNRLNNTFGLDEYLEDDYDSDDFIEEIEDVLMDIL